MRHLSLFVFTFCFGKLQFLASYFYGFLHALVRWIGSVKRSPELFSKLSSTLQFFNFIVTQNALKSGPRC